MSVECSECERDLRGGHAPMCSRHPASSIVREIAAERRRQIEIEGWTPEHDDEHGNAELARAAAAYARCSATYKDGLLTEASSYARSIWPWNRSWWKPKNPRRDLIRAAALIVAEIERLDRIEKP